MSPLHHDRDEIVMVRGGAGAGVPMTLDEVRVRGRGPGPSHGRGPAAASPPLPRLSVDLLVAVASLGVLGLAIAALLFLPR
jgi:hypothetical protein